MRKNISYHYELISTRYGLGNVDGFNLAENGYYHVSITSPIFGVGTGPRGVAHDLMYRRMAWESWANNGYTDGFLNYASNKLKGTGKDAPNVTDSDVAKSLSNGKYSNLKDLKKEWLLTRQSKLVDLKPITFIMNNKTYTIANSMELKDLIYQTLDNDIAKNRKDIDNLKRHIYAAYFKLTNEFREDVYKK